jgi:hypothetical protein
MLPYPPAPKNKRGRAWLIVLPILLLVCSASGWFCVNTDLRLGNDVRLTGFLAQQKLQATATYAATHYPFGTDILFEDDLRSTSGKWKTGAGCANQGGALHVSAAQAGTFSPCLSTYTPFHESSGKYSYEVTLKQMDATAAGLIFRGRAQDPYYHFFLVSRDGSYALSVYDPLEKAKPYQVLKSGKMKDQLSFPVRIGVVIIDKQKIGLYANEVELANLNDDNAGTTGYLGVAVFNDQAAKVAWADFVNAKCWAHHSDWITSS